MTREEFESIEVGDTLVSAFGDPRIVYSVTKKSGKTHRVQVPSLNNHRNRQTSQYSYLNYYEARRASVVKASTSTLPVEKLT